MPRSMLLQFRSIFGICAVLLLVLLGFAHTLSQDQRALCLVLEMLAIGAFAHTFFVRTQP